MKVWFKRSVVGAVALFLVALLGLAIFLLTFDPNAYKAKVQDLVAERYHRTLLINGDISLSLFPRLGLTVKDVSLSNRETTSVFASVEQARIAVAIWPLLSNHLVVDHVSVDGFRVWVTRSSEGLLNFQDLIEGSPQGVDPAQAAVMPAVASGANGVATPAGVAGPAADRLDPSSAQLNIDIAGLELKDGEVHFSDAQKGYSGNITGVQLSTGRVTFDQPFDVTLRGQLKAANPVADARFQGQALLRLDRTQNQYAAQKLNIQIEGQLASLQARTLTLQGNVAYVAANRQFNASGLSLALQGRINGEQPVDNLSASLAAPQLKVDPSRAQLEVQRLALRMSGKTPTESFDVAFDAPSLFVSPEEARGDSVAGTVKLDGESVLGLALEMSGLGGNASQLTLKGLKVDGTFRQADRLTRINMLSPVRWNAETSELALTAIKGDVKIDAKALGPSGFEFPLIGSVLLNINKQTLSSDLNAVLNGNPLSFSTRVTGFDKPAVRLNLKADELDFDKLFPAVASVPAQATRPDSKQAADNQVPEPQAGSPAAAASPESPPADVESLDLTFLDTINLVADARVGRLSGRGLVATDVVLDARAEKGRLDLGRLDANLYGGKLSGKASATSKNVFALQASLAGISVGPVVAALSGESRLTGTGNLRLNLSSRAGTTDQILPALGGTVQLALRDGAVKGFNLEQKLAEISAALATLSKGQVPDFGARYDLSQETRFTSLDTNLTFTKGVGTINKLAVAAPLLRVSQGSPAQINLANNSLDVVSVVRVVNTTQGQGGPDLSRLKGVAIPLRVQGPFNDISYGIDVKSLVSGAARQLLEQGLKDVIQQKAAPPGQSPSSPDAVKDLGNTLKGLLGR